LIDEKGENVGVIETPEALRMAQDKGLDLIEVAPNTKPPVCKIMSWSKFKYNLSKKSRGSSKGKAKDVKEMRFSPYISMGDIEHKKRKVEEFLTKKHPVKLTIFVKGRVDYSVVRSQLDKILDILKGKFETDQFPRKEGRNLSILVFPLKKTLIEKDEPEKKPPPSSTKEKK